MPATKSQSASLPSSPICLPLQKFSTAIVPRNSVGPLPWTHLPSHGNLFAIFDTVRTVRSDGRTTDSKRFKILQDPDVLEDIDLDLLASESRRAIDMARDASDHNRDHNVAVIKKLPVVAVKYPMSGGQVKRFQIRFRGDADFYEALKQMANAGVHMLEAGTFPNNRPQDVHQTSAQHPQHMQQQSYVKTRSATPVISALDPSLSINKDISREPMLPPSDSPITRTNPSDLQYFQKQSADQIHVEPGPPPFANHGANSKHDSDPAVDIGIYGLLGQKTSAIDLYTPRPFAAPAQVSQHLDQLLPPPRELPFKSSSNAVKRKPPAEAEHTEQQRRISDHGNDGVGIITHVPDSQEVSGSQSSAKRAKKAGKKPAAKESSVGKKKRAPVYRCDECRARGPRTRCRHKETTPPVPSIDEVFGQIQSTVKGVAEVDTQALLNRSAATKQRDTAKATSKLAELHLTTRITRSMSAIAEGGGVTTRPVVIDLPPSLKLPPCTPADQVVGRVTTPGAPPPPIESANHTALQSPTRANMGPAKNPPVTIGEQRPHDRLVTALHSTLECHPFFKDAETKLANFTDGTRQEQLEQLESWVLKHGFDRHFKQLCELMGLALSTRLGVGLYAQV